MPSSECQGPPLKRGGDRVSVIVPTFQAEGHIRETAREILAALEPRGGELELLFVDDGSRDRTPEVLAEVAAADGRVRVRTLPRNGGKGEAVLEGIRCARGDILLFLDDDVTDLAPEVVGAMLDGVEEGCDLVSGTRSGVDARGMRGLARGTLRWLASAAAGRRVADPTSPYLCARRAVFDDIDRLPGMRAFPHEYAVVRARTVREVGVDIRARKVTRSRFTTRRLAREFTKLAVGLARMGLARGRRGGTRP